jgi:hypothetical protein
LGVEDAGRQAQQGVNIGYAGLFTRRRTPAIGSSSTAA